MYNNQLKIEKNVYAIFRNADDELIGVYEDEIDAAEAVNNFNYGAIYEHDMAEIVEMTEEEVEKWKRQNK